MAHLIKVIGAIVTSVGVVTGIAFAVKPTPPPALTAKLSSPTVRETTNLKNTEITKEGYYVLADWGDTQWKVKSDKFSKLDGWVGQELKFNDVEMYLGDKKLERGHEFTTQGNSKQYVLHKMRGYKYKLENGKEFIFSELMNQWNNLGVKKYDETPLKEWRKGWNVFDYDIEFDTCKFVQLKEQNLNDRGAKIKVTCQVGRPQLMIWKELTEKDYK